MQMVAWYKKRFGIEISQNEKAAIGCRRAAGLLRLVLVVVGL
jgi:hypothetical protein